MRVAALLAVALCSCSAPLEFHCETTQQCAFTDHRARCENDGYCSFADPSCESGFRYGEWASPALRSRCTDASACPNGICRGCAVQLELGQRFGCVRLTDGTVECWGGNGSGQLGRGNNAGGGSTPARVVASPSQTGKSLTGVVDLAVGSYHGCALLDSGATVCWGANGNLQLGDGDGGAAYRAGPVRVIDQNAGPLTGVIDVAAGFDHSCARLGTQEVVCWGNNTYGALGDGTRVSRPYAAPVLLASGTPLRASSVSCSTTASCATNDGGVLCWGAGVYGQLGNGLQDHQDRPVTVLGEGKVPLVGAKRVAIGSWSACAVLAPDDRAVCWGDDSFGQLGDGTFTSRSTASDVLIDLGQARLAGVLDLASFFHACAITAESGHTWCWGQNDDGELGSGKVGPDAGVPYPTVVMDSSGAPFLGLVQIRTGSSHSCGLRDDGTVWCWGGNSEGQLGSPDTSLVAAHPIQVALTCP